MFTRSLSLLTLVPVLFAGCAAGPYETSRPVSTIRSIEFATPFSYAPEDGSWKWEAVLLAGKYTAAREDDNGTYYVGPRGCFLSKLVRGTWTTPAAQLNKEVARDCGIYVPSAQSEGVRIFVIFRSTAATQQLDESTRPLLGANVPDASIGQAAAGTAIGVSVVQSIMDLADGGYLWFQAQPRGTSLRDHITR